MNEIDPFQQITNTTLAVVASNARFNKSQTTKIAQMAHNALARTIDTGAYHVRSGIPYLHSRRGKWKPM